MQHAHKISAIKRKGEHPHYSQQKGANLPPASSQGHSGQPKKSKKNNWKGKGKQHTNVADEYSSPNTFTLVASAVPAQPQIAIQPSRAPPNTSTIVLFNSNGQTYSKVVLTGPSAYNGIPRTPGMFFLQEERSLLPRIGEQPTTQPLKQAVAILNKGVTADEAVACLSRREKKQVKQAAKAADTIATMGLPPITLGN